MLLITTTTCTISKNLTKFVFALGLVEVAKDGSTPLIYNLILLASVPWVVSIASKT